MAVTFVLGRAGAGKTRYCLDALLSELDGPAKDRHLILLVPEQASFQMERALATSAPQQGYQGAEVLSFSRLATRGLADKSDSSALLGVDARTMALRYVVQQTADSLRFPRGTAQTGGFHTQLNRLIEELLREQISPTELETAAQGVTDKTTQRKIADIAHLYRQYLDWLGTERIDPAARLAHLREHVGDVRWLRNARIWVDGFAGFTSQELQTLVSLAQLARDLTITLLLDAAALSGTARPSNDPLRLFHRTEQTYLRLREMFIAAGVKCQEPVKLHPVPLPRFAQSATLARLEIGLAMPLGIPPEESSSETNTSDGVTVLECLTHREELRCAARYIRQKILASDGQLRFRDFAVIARDLEPFTRMIAEVFDEYELPYFLDRRRPMRAHPLSRLVAALFETISNGYSLAAVTRLLRTGLLPILRSQAEELENLATRHSVAGIDLWRQGYWDFAPGSRDNAESTAELDAARLKLVAALEPLEKLDQGNAPATGADWAQALFQTLEALEVRTLLAGWSSASRLQPSWERIETHRLAWEALCGVLENLHDVLGTTTLETGDVARIVGTALSEHTLGLAPPTLDQVLVASIERSRHPDIKYAWVFGFNEGLFPAPPPDDRLLNTDEREALIEKGLTAPASHRDDIFGERLLAYIAFTRPHCGLTISYATLDMNGGPLLPSPLLDEVQQALPELRFECATDDAPPVSLTDLARACLHVGAADDVSVAERERVERLRGLIREMPAIGERLGWLLRGEQYRNGPEEVGNYRPSGVADVTWNGSPSEIETFLACPFKHFARYGLRLDAMRGPYPLRWDLGSYAHEILANVTRRAMDTAEGVRGLSDERWRELYEQEFERFRADLAGVARRQPDLAFQGQLLCEFLVEVIAVHAARWRRGRFQPAGCELSFGSRPDRGDLPPLVLEISGGRRGQLRGQIDRLDVYREGDQLQLIVYDYKSKTQKIKTDFLTGARLQLFSYLLVAGQAYGGDRSVCPAGVFLAPLYPDTKVLETQYGRSADELTQLMYCYRPRGLFRSDVAALLDEQLGENVSPVAGMKLKRDGDFNGTYSKDVVSPQEMEQYLELTRRTLRWAVEGIVAGKVQAAPLVEKRTLACQHCDYKPVCRFDRILNPPRLAEAVLPTLDRIRNPESGGAP
ncbi:MAG: PD-(D/E)XK nuclease family protein [Planctomycetota bacterium]